MPDAAAKPQRVLAQRPRERVVGLHPRVRASRGRDVTQRRNPAKLSAGTPQSNGFVETPAMPACPATSVTPEKRFCPALDVCDAVTRMLWIVRPRRTFSANGAANDVFVV